MISTGISNFSRQLNGILTDLQSHRRDKSELMEKCVEVRLTKSLQTYYKEMIAAAEYLNYRNNDNLIKKYERVMR